MRQHIDHVFHHRAVLLRGVRVKARWPRHVCGGDRSLKFSSTAFQVIQFVSDRGASDNAVRDLVH
ncbi:MAG TPA: hypothetical protein VGL66_09700 [Caulobacteraceae bacterium]